MGMNYANADIYTDTDAVKEHIFGIELLAGIGTKREIP